MNRSTITETSRTTQILAVVGVAAGIAASAAMAALPADPPSVVLAASCRVNQWTGEPETDAERRGRELRESGYDGWMDQDGRAVACPFCGDSACRLGISGHYGGAR